MTLTFWVDGLSGFPQQRFQLARLLETAFRKHVKVPKNLQDRYFLYLQHAKMHGVQCETLTRTGRFAESEKSLLAARDLYLEAGKCASGPEKKTPGLRFERQQQMLHTYSSLLSVYDGMGPLNDKIAAVTGACLVPAPAPASADFSAVLCSQDA